MPSEIERWIDVAEAGMENEILIEHSNALGEIEIFMVNDPLEQQKRLVEEVLQGIVTPESDPAVGEDDLLYLAVAGRRKGDGNCSG